MLLMWFGNQGKSKRKKEGRERESLADDPVMRQQIRK
jgi:hypothetical protein